MFQTVNIRDLDQNAVQMVADRWLLISAGKPEDFNMMTASWGMLGEIWGKDAAAVFVRPSRYTYRFLEQSEYFALSVLPDELHDRVHAVCGSQSGRDVDKAAATGLTPVFDHSVYFEQTEIVLICKKIYTHDIDPHGFLDPSIGAHYHGDYHRMYVGEIVKTLVRA